MASTKDAVIDLDQEEINTDQLQFQDIPHAESSDSLKAAEAGGNKVQTHTFTNFPNPEDSDEDGDKTDLLQEGRKQHSFWTFEYYQQFFDVDTRQVLYRIAGSMIPNPKGMNYLERHIRPNPDLYGPFWICATLVFTTAIAGNLANYFAFAGQNYTWHYDFHKVTFAASAIFGYWWLIPTLLWVLLWWRGSQAGYSFLEMVCVYGYSLAVYIPISILWLIQLSWLQWLLVMLGMALSGSVLLMVFWPAVKDDDKKIALSTMVVIMVFHGLLAVGFVLYFFHVPATEAPSLMTNSTTLSAAVSHPSVTSTSTPMTLTT